MKQVQDGGGRTHAAAASHMDVGREMGLVGRRLVLFVNYMRRRWGCSEDQHVQTGYSHIWADRFVRGDEYMLSDADGRALLVTLQQEAACGSRVVVNSGGCA